jgi:integrase
MKTTTGSLITRGSNYYCFWRYRGKAFSRVLRDESGQAITRKAEAERAKDKLMEIVAKQNHVESLRSIQHEIDDRQGEITALQAAKDPPLPLAQTWTAFLKSTERRDCGKSTLRQYESKWSMFFDWMTREHPDKTTLPEVDAKIATGYLDSLNHGRLAPATYNFHLLTLRYIFRVLKDEARLPENVWLKPKPKTMITQSRRELTVDELRKVCTAVTGEVRLMLAIGLYTGLRLGDAATLKWCETDLRRSQIQRIPNKTGRRKPKPITIPIHPALHALLAEIPAADRGEFVLPVTANTYLNGSRSLVTNGIQKLFTNCGIKTTEARENGGRAIVRVGFHSLRHSFISMCREAGAPLSVVESIVGHHSVDMTRHYSHTSQLAATNAVALLPTVTGNAPPQPEKRDADAILREAKAALQCMTAANWKAKRAELLALCANEAEKN